MSFFGKLANIFGFGDSDEVLEDTAAVEGGGPALTDANPRQVDPAPSLELDKGRTDAIFERVLAIFNASLPDFLARSVDADKQKQCLYEALDASMKEYLESLKLAADQNARASWQSEHERLIAEAEALKKKTSDLEGAKSEIKDKQLSAERQRRALSERVRDLEEQVLRLEAEKEQFEIENKCMLNKAKASAVLEAEIEDLRSRMGGDNAGTASSEELDGAKSKIEALERDNEELRAQVETFSRGAKVKDEMGEAMLNELQAKASEANANAASLQRQVEENANALDLANAKLEDARRQSEEREAMCEMLKSDAEQKDAKINELEEELEELRAQVADDDETQREMEEIQKQIGLFEQVKTKMDARIEKLKASLHASQKENESLRDTIRENLIEHARVQKELNERIAELDAELNPKSDAVEIDFAQQSSHPLADADWLLPAPPVEESMRVEDSADFGYKPPKIKPRIETESHPSLFD
ncbi:MAG: hypothetical protein NC102_03860 [Clostridium sp.]|nr:hypothetical protein [Clostridium sp.]